MTPVAANVTIIPAIKTPAKINGRAFLHDIPKANAASGSVHAPVIGRDFNKGKKYRDHVSDYKGCVKIQQETYKPPVK